MNSTYRESLLRLAWQGVRRDPARLANLPAARRAIDAGASPDDLARAMSAAAYEAVFALLFVLDEGGDPHSDQASSESWRVVALPRGEHLAGLHEEVLMADPTGREGSDLFS